MKTFDEFAIKCPWKTAEQCMAVCTPSGGRRKCKRSNCAPYRAYRMAVEDVQRDLTDELRGIY